MRNKAVLSVIRYLLYAYKGRNFSANAYYDNNTAFLFLYRENAAVEVTKKWIAK